MDDTDRRILRILQDDSSLSVSDVARQVGLSSSPCWKRIRRLQGEGVIRQQRAILDAERLGFGLTVFVNIVTGEHSSAWLTDFAAKITAMPEVLELHRMAGDVDYMLKIVAPDMRSFDAFYKRLTDITALTEVTSRFSMETIKETTALPI